ncbi:MAG: hypothetical protein QGD94_05975, partial [Planctomycetia bacterium]|nr:hypothetical protein [Planctomycetia bacterium]
MKTRTRGKGVTMHVISNSHWDREWLLSFRQLQVRLVDVMDQLLEVMEKDPSYRYFTLDGQTVPIEDYLEIRPENAERLGKLISGGRIIVGPWFILAHHSLCTGEAIVRNLLRGCRITKKMGGKIGAGYTPGSFGQISQLPQLYAGVGIDNIIFYRGINSFIMPDSEFTWEGADGTRALGYHFPESFSRVAMYIKMRTVFENCKAPDDLDYTPRGKEFPAHLCDEESVGGFYETLNQKMTEKFDKQKALEALLELRDGLAKAAKAPHLWFGWGFDHSYIDYFTPRLIELMQPLLGDDRLVHSNLLKFIESVKKDIKGKRLKTMKGEMRHTNKEGTICYLSPHVISSRMDLKLANARAERMLFRQAEPAATMAYLCGADYPARFLNLAERQILLNQAHDSICGCSIDQVPRDMHYRYEQCFGLSGEIIRRSVFHIVEKIDYSGVAEGDVPITVFNTLAQKRSCVVRAAIDVPMKKGYLKEFELVDERGRVVPVQPIHTEDKRLLIMAKYNMPPRIDVERHHIYFAAEDVPSMGYKSYVARVRVKARKTFWQRELKEHKPTLVKAPNTMENEFLHIEITPKGTVNMLHKETGKRFTDMHYFEDGGDLGEGWNYVPPARDEVVSSLGQSARISLVEDGPLCARYRVETEVLAPASGSRGENARSAGR